MPGCLGNPLGILPLLELAVHGHGAGPHLCLAIERKRQLEVWVWLENARSTVLSILIAVVTKLATSKPVYSNRWTYQYWKEGNKRVNLHLRRAQKRWSFRTRKNLAAGLDIVVLGFLEIALHLVLLCNVLVGII